MTAQLGNSLLLQYGNAGQQQAGNAVLLSFDAGAVAPNGPVTKSTIRTEF